LLVFIHLFVRMSMQDYEKIMDYFYGKNPLSYGFILFKVAK